MARRNTNEDAPIFQMQDNKAAILQEVAERTTEKLLQQHSPEFVLNDAAYKELLRLNKKHPQTEYWQGIYRSLNRLSEADLKAQLLHMAHQYAEDIIGRFDPKVYRFATSMVPYVLSLFLDPQLTLRERHSFQEKILIEGHVDTARELTKKGTVILVPTHGSNIDSISAGWSAYRSGLPPVTYGAGKNLFTNRILSFFMHNLGAYRLDRRIKHELYKTVLKTYSLVILERGFHSLFFPGGTRSRSGQIEQHLKLGLMGTGLEAYINNLRKGKDKPNIYLLPMTINYYLVLEAETLINDFLKEQGKSRYIIEDDESSKFIKTFSYMKKTLDLDASMYIRYAPPLDIFGNRVDDEGVSYDDQGRAIDPSRYVKNWSGEIVMDEARDHEYTREAGAKVAESYLKNNVILSPHLVSYVLFRYLVHKNPRLDLYQLIRIGAREAQIDRLSLVRAIERFKQFLARQESQGVLRMATTLKNKPADMILDEAVYYMQMFYSKEIVVMQADKLHVQDMRLLYYYHNRLVGYHFESRFSSEILDPVADSAL
ncbi:MAG: 1-acyl-sn-glycerol-3-phosphate acyltransferase [Candidatus Sericytochromatia bacterium]|nr:1-acyl-sn-glycerol-3-phosphate acyltransferase [Candidatus Sericytochromatia bacterium]